MNFGIQRLDSVHYGSLDWCQIDRRRGEFLYFGYHRLRRINDGSLDWSQGRIDGFRGGVEALENPVRYGYGRIVQDWEWRYPYCRFARVSFWMTLPSHMIATEKRNSQVLAENSCMSSYLPRKLPKKAGSSFRTSCSRSQQNFSDQACLKAQHWLQIAFPEICYSRIPGPAWPIVDGTRCSSRISALFRTFEA